MSQLTIPKGLANVDIQIRDGNAYMEYEGYEYALPSAKLNEYCERMYTPPGGALMIPDGVKFFRWRRPYLVVVHEQPPMLRQTRWIAKDSPKDYGKGTTYRPVRLSLPYTVTISSYVINDDERTSITGSNQLFFRTNMLKHISDNLFYPALLNVSVVGSNNDQTWICTQYLATQPSDKWQAILTKLLDHLWNGAFNYSSEHHEGASWFTRYKQAGIKEIAPIENWETASKSAVFGYKFKNWLPCAYNLEAAIENIFNALGAPDPSKIKKARVVDQMAYHLLNHGTKVEVKKKDQ